MWWVGHHLLLGVAVTTLGAAALRAASRAAPAGVERVIAAGALGAAAAVLWALGLGLVALGASPAALTVAALATWLAARAWLPDPALGPGRELALAWRGLPAGGRLAAGALAGLVAVYAAWLSRYPYLGADGLGYHLPDVLGWLRDGRPGSQNAVLPLIPVQNYPMTNEVLLTWFVGISRGLAVIAPFQLAHAVLLGASTMLGLRALGLSGGVRAAAAGVAVTFPILVGQLNGPLTDLPAVAWLAAAAALAATAAAPGPPSPPHAAAVRRPALLGPALVAGGLAVGIKTTTALPALLALGAAGWALRGALPRRAMALAGLAAVAVGGVWYLRNLVQHGSPLWPLVSAPWGDPKPRFLQRFDVRFLAVPGDTLSAHFDTYRVQLAGGLAMMAGALAAPLLARRRRVVLAAAAGVGLVVVWMNAPYTGIAPRPVFSELAVSTIRYLMPAVLACTLAVALAAGGRGWRARAALGLLLGALGWNVVEDLRAGFPFVPSAFTLAAGAGAGAAAALLAGLLPAPRRVPRPVLAAFPVLVVVALVPAASGYGERHVDVGYIDADLVRWFSGQAGFQAGARPVAQAPIVNAILAGDRLTHPVPVVDREPCARVRRRADAGWVVIGDTPFADYNRIGQAAERCLAGRRPLAVVSGHRVYGPAP